MRGTGRISVTEFAFQAGGRVGYDVLDPCTIDDVLVFDVMNGVTSQNNSNWGYFMNQNIRIGGDDVMQDQLDIFLDGATLQFFDNTNPMSTVVTAGTSDTIDNLTLSSDSAIEFGTLGGGVHDFKVNDFVFNGNALDITRWGGTPGVPGTPGLGSSGTSGRIYVQMIDGVVPVPGQYPAASVNWDIDGNGSIDATGYEILSIVDGYYELIPMLGVPEPSTWLGGGSIVAFAFMHYVRRRRKKVGMDVPAIL